MVTTIDPDAFADQILEELVVRGARLVECQPFEIGKPRPSDDTTVSFRLRDAQGTTVQTMTYGEAIRRQFEIAGTGGVMYNRDRLFPVCLGCARHGVSLGFTTYHGKGDGARRFCGVTIMVPPPAPMDRFMPKDDPRQVVEDILDRLSENPAPRVLEHLAARLHRIELHLAVYDIPDKILGVPDIPGFKEPRERMTHEEMSLELRKIGEAMRAFQSELRP